MGLGIRSALKELTTVVSVAWRHARTPRDARLDVLLLCHALEKGMGMPSPRRGFGQAKCDKLVSALKRMADAGRSASWEYDEGMAVLSAYLEYQETDGLDVSMLRASAAGLPGSREHCRGGYTAVGRNELEAGMTVDVPLLFESKHSMREYSDDPLDEGTLLAAIDLARRSPSACNRQPWKVYYSTNATVNESIRQSLPAQAFLEGVPSFLVVACDKTLFNRSEVCQWYVNGGIFLAYLTLALHHLGMGSIILEYNLGSASESDLRLALGMEPGDEVIAIVGCGRYPDEAKWICAERRPREDIAVNAR